MHDNAEKVLGAENRDYRRHVIAKAVISCAV